MGKSEKEKLNEAMLVVKSLCEKRPATDAVRIELEVAFACMGRARRLDAERPQEAP